MLLLIVMKERFGHFDKGSLELTHNWGAENDDNVKFHDEQ